MLVENEIHDIKKEISIFGKILAKLEQTLEIVLVDHKQRLTKNEKSIDHIENSLHGSCDSMTKAIDNKIEKSEDHTYERIRETKVSVVKMIVGQGTVIALLFGLFVGAVVYFSNENTAIRKANNDSHRAMEHKIATYHEHTVANNTKLDYIITMIQKLENHPKEKSH